MSRFTGRQQEGAARTLKERKRLEADTRNALTKPERRSQKQSPKSEAPLDNRLALAEDSNI